MTSGSVYTALAGKADATATQTAMNSKADATATQTALAGKQNALTAGANITIETVNDVLTISATDTTYSAATAAPGNVASASAQGNSSNYARQDHTHGIDVATGDDRGQVKIAGINVSVKDIGTMAYKNCFVCTQAQYEALTPQSATIYLIVE